MDELTLTFAKARFDKEALSPQLIAQMQALAGTPELSDNKRKLRDLIEQSIRGEQSKTEEAKKLIGYGKKRLTDPDRMGGAGTMALDTIRALIPGLSISASADDGIEKSAKDPDERGSGRLFDVLHGLAAAGGAGAGVAAQKGLFGGAYGRDVAERVVGGSEALQKSLLDKVLGEVGKNGPGAVRKAFEGAGRTHDLGLASQRHTSIINKITKLLSGGAWRRRVAGGGATPTAWQARKALMGDVRKRLGREAFRSGPARAAIRGLPDALTKILGTARASGVRAGFMPGGWKGGLLGAALTTAPFAIYRLLKTRSLRQRGGTAAESAAEKAEKLLSEAGELRGSRQKLLAG